MGATYIDAAGASILAAQREISRCPGGEFGACEQLPWLQQGLHVPSDER